MKSGQVVIHQVEEEEITFVPCVVCNRDTDYSTNHEFDSQRAFIDGEIDIACVCCFKKAVCRACYFLLWQE